MHLIYGAYRSSMVLQEGRKSRKKGRTKSKRGKKSKTSKKGRKKLNEFIAEYDGFTSIKSISKNQVEFTYIDGSKKNLNLN